MFLFIGIVFGFGLWIAIIHCTGLNDWQNEQNRNNQEYQQTLQQHMFDDWDGDGKPW